MAGLSWLTINENSLFSICKNGDPVTHIIGDEELAYVIMKAIRSNHICSVPSKENYDGLYCWTVEHNLFINVDEDTGVITLFDDLENEPVEFEGEVPWPD